MWENWSAGDVLTRAIWRLLLSRILVWVLVVSSVHVCIEVATRDSLGKSLDRVLHSGLLDDSRSLGDTVSASLQNWAPGLEISVSMQTKEWTKSEIRMSKAEIGMLKAEIRMLKTYIGSRVAWKVRIVLELCMLRALRGPVSGRLGMVDACENVRKWNQEYCLRKLTFLHDLENQRLRDRLLHDVLRFTAARVFGWVDHLWRVLAECEMCNRYHRETRWRMMMMMMKNDDDEWWWNMTRSWDIIAHFWYAHNPKRSARIPENVRRQKTDACGWW